MASSVADEVFVMDIAVPASFLGMLPPQDVTETPFVLVSPHGPAKRGAVRKTSKRAAAIFHVRVHLVCLKLFRYFEVAYIVYAVANTRIRPDGISAISAPTWQDFTGRR